MWNIHFKRQTKNGLNVHLQKKTQNSIRPDLQALTNYFNDFILYSLRSDILKRVIVNQMSGSSWYFKRFLNLALKVLDSTELNFSY